MLKNSVNQNYKLHKDDLVRGFLVAVRLMSKIHFGDMVVALVTTVKIDVYENGGVYVTMVVDKSFD